MGDALSHCAASVLTPLPDLHFNIHLEVLISSSWLANPTLLWFWFLAPSKTVEILKVAIGSVESRLWWWFWAVRCDRDECEREFELDLKEMNLMAS